MAKTVVILPTYNEAPNIEHIVEAIFAQGVDNLHILIVDDESPDGTGKIADLLAAKYAPYLSVIHNKTKGGLGPAYKLGFKRALAEGADYCFQMDSDFSHQPKHIPEMLEKVQSGYDMVCGSRYTKGGGVDENWGPHRKLLSWFANRVYVSTILQIPIKDATGGFRCWTRDAIIGLDLDRIRASGYVFQVEITYVSYRLGYKIAEVPIYFPDRERGDSKMDTRIMLEAALRVWQIRGRHRKLTPADRRTEDYS